MSRDRYHVTFPADVYGRRWYCTVSVSQYQRSYKYILIYYVFGQYSWVVQCTRLTVVLNPNAYNNNLLELVVNLAATIAPIVLSHGW